MATRKPAVPTDEKLEKTEFDLFKAIEAIDRKDYGYWDTLTEEQQKKFTPYMMLHWISAIKTTGMLGAYYVMSTDANANKYMFNETVYGHPKLQWLMLCAASPGMGKQFHQWIPHLNAKIAKLQTKATKKEVKEYFEKVYPGCNKAELDQVSDIFVADQHHKIRLSEMFPNMKISDIETLAKVVSQEELDEYEKQSGN
jgi:hypothetical protein